MKPNGATPERRHDCPLLFEECFGLPGYTAGHECSCCSGHAARRLGTTYAIPHHCHIVCSLAFAEARLNGVEPREDDGGGFVSLIKLCR